ncbi:MAG: hypothetical protein LBU02_02995 [Rickettsiales bacterium]|jgi:hypothetical protein|nr:hypothetical protein [Rickettsiales bacterium]
MPNNEMNLNRVEPSSTFMGTLQNKLKDIKNFSNWSTKEQMVAVTAVGVIFGALLPVVAVALPVAAAGAAVALTLFFAVKAVEYGYKGLKWSAEKTWEGLKSLGKGIKDGTSTAADRLGDSLKRAAHGDEYSMEESKVIQDLLKEKGIEGVVNNTIEIVKANNSSVPSKIKSAIKSAIDLKIGELGSADEESNLKEKGNLEKQRKIVDRLEEILTKSPLDTKELALITEVFSQYQSEVKGILDDYAQNPKNYPKPPTFSQRMSSSLSSPFSSLKRKFQQPSNPPSPVTDSTNDFSAPDTSRSPSLNSLESDDSGRGSPGSSTPTGRQSLSMRDVEGGNPQAKLRITNSPYKPEQPSTHMSEQKHTPVNRHLETLV